MKTGEFQGEGCNPLAGIPYSVPLNSSNGPTAPLPTCMAEDSDPGVAGRAADLIWLCLVCLTPASSSALPAPRDLPEKALPPAPASIIALTHSSDSLWGWSLGSSPPRPTVLQADPVLCETDPLAA